MQLRLPGTPDRIVQRGRGRSVVSTPPETMRKAAFEARGCRKHC